MKHKELAFVITSKERDRILHRAKRFEWERDYLLKRLLDGGKRVIPKPQDREKLVLHIHEGLRHFGVKKTYSFLQTQYWWVREYKSSLQTHVQCTVVKCQACHTIRPSFNAPTFILQPLSIMGLGYRWSLDFGGPVLIIKRDNRYVLVMIEHFPK